MVVGGTKLDGEHVLDDHAFDLADAKRERRNVRTGLVREGGHEIGIKGAIRRRSRCGNHGSKR